MENSIKKENGWRYSSFCFFIADSIIFIIILHGTIKKILLARDGVISIFEGYLGVSFYFFLFLFFDILFLKYFLQETKKPLPLPPLLPPKFPIKTLLKNGMLFLIISHIPLLLTLLPSAKGNISFVWLPLEWYKLPKNILFVYHISPSFVFGMLLIFIFVLWLLTGKGKKFIMTALVFFLAVFSYKLSVNLSAGGRHNLYLIILEFPVLLMLIGCLQQNTRLFARTALLFACLSLIFLFYVGFLPVYFKTIKDVPHLQLIYPKEGKKSAIALPFLRDLYVDTKRHYIFTAYGPTSGIVRINIKTSGINIIDTGTGLVRYIWTDDQTPYLYAVDWVNADILIISKQPFKIQKRINIYDENFLIPMSFTVNKDKIFVVSTEYPMITEFDRKTVDANRRFIHTNREHKWKRRIFFRELGITRFRSGVWKSALYKKGNKIFAEVGMIDTSDKFAIVRIDINKFKIDKVLYLSEGGLELLPIESKGTMFVTSFFSENLYEIDMNTMKLLRVFKGPLNCRNIVYDERRNLLYALGFAKGEVIIINYETGKQIKKILVGKKPSSMFFLQNLDELYIGSSWGVMKINLKSLLGKD